MISSKPRLVIPYGLKTLLEGVSRAVLKVNPSNINQFAATYFKELIAFREGLLFLYKCCFEKESILNWGLMYLILCVYSFREWMSGYKRAN